MSLSEYRSYITALTGGFLVAIFLVEGFLMAYRFVKRGKVAGEDAINVREESRRDPLGEGNRVENVMVLHLFFGYTHNPKDKGVNNFGFDTKYAVSLEKSAYSIQNVVRSELLVVGSLVVLWPEILESSTLIFLRKSLRAPQMFFSSLPMIRGNKAVFTGRRDRWKTLRAIRLLSNKPACA